MKDDLETELNYLIIEPHNTLLTPQGSRARLDGTISLLGEENCHFLVPKGSNLHGIAENKVRYFREPVILGRACPYLLDWSRSFRSTLRDVVQEVAPDFIVYHFPWGLFSTAADIQCPAIYYSAGVETDFARITCSHLGLDYLLPRLILETWIKYIERRACQTAELVITMSDQDISRYHHLFDLTEEQSHKYWTLPHPVKPETSVSPDQKAAAKRTLGLRENAISIGFHGLWSHLPNREAILALSNNIAPTVLAKCANVQFVVAGTGVPQNLGDNLISLGYVEDLAQFIMAIDLAVVPIFSGCGLRMKLFDYFSRGVPVVSTTKGAEGLPLASGQELLIVEDSVEAMAEAIVEVLENFDQTPHLVNNAFRYLADHHQPNLVKKRLIAELEKSRSRFFEAKL